MATLHIYFYIACGGAIGACMRFFISQQSIKLLGNSFPFGTLIVNILGSFALGCFYLWLEQQHHLTNNLRFFIAVGLLGALTTFSTFSYETVVLLYQTEYLKAFLNILLNISLCILGVWLAFLLLKG